MASGHHKVAFGSIASDGTISNGLGFKTVTHDADKNYYYRIDYSKGFEENGMTVVSPLGSEGGHRRVNWYSGSEDRKENVPIDCFQQPVNEWERVAEVPGSSCVLSADANPGDIKPFKVRGKDTPIAIVAGVIGPTYTASTSYGTFTVTQGTTATDLRGIYVIQIPKATFAQVPTAVATIEQDLKQVRTVEVKEIVGTAQQWQVTITVRNRCQCLVPGKFHFIAIGEAPAGTTTAQGRLLTGAVKSEVSTKNTNLDIFSGSEFTAQQSTTARYEVTFSNGKNFTQTPVIVACTEHATEKHLRQAQIHDVGKGSFKIDVFGVTYPSNGDFNTARFHFMAYAPT